VSLDNDPFLAVALRAARTAGSIVVDAARDLRRLPAFSREHADIVTSADMEAQDAIIAAIRAAFPDHAILGRESGQITGAREGAGYRWLIDAIDGAANFVHGFPAFAVSIALIHANEITHAVVVDPVHDEAFAAIKAKGATQNGVTLHVSACLRLADALVGTVLPPRDSPKLASHLAAVSALAAQCGGVRMSGSCALQLAHLAAGRLDAFFMSSLKPWDIAAGALLVREAGGRIGDFAGGSQFLRTSEVIAATPGVFSLMREAIAGAG
jgi:myo-inositol-1(or 4)-monophosphatase